FFLFIQSVCLFVFFKVIDANSGNTTFIEGLKKHWLKWLLFGLAFVILSISKSIAIVAVPAVVVFFLLNKNFKQAVYAIVAFALVRIVYELLVNSVYGPNASGQFEMILRKDLYKPELGH